MKKQKVYKNLTYLCCQGLTQTFASPKKRARTDLSPRRRWAYTKTNDDHKTEVFLSIYGENVFIKISPPPLV